jgi:hypothetical protein
MTNLFDSLINRVASFVASKGGFSHVMAVLFAGAVLAYAQVPSFHALVQQVYAALPAWLEQWVLAGVGLYAWYRTSNSMAGTLARARAIKESPDAPTAKQVDAADPNVTK